jgi:serine protease Do
MLPPAPAKQSAAKTAAAPPTKPAPPTTSPTANLLGLGLVDLNDKLRQAYGIAAGARGVLIVSGDSDKHLAAGDLIVGVSTSAIASIADLRKGIDDAKSSGKKSVLLHVTTNANARFVALNIQ